MKTWIAALIVGVMTASFALDADAQRRLGGGKTFGKQSTPVQQRQATPPQQQPQAAPAQQANQPAAQPAAAGAATAGAAKAASPDRQTFSASTLPGSIGGLLTWTAGANTGLAMEVKAASAGAITLALPMPYDIAAGDSYSVTAGCDKNLSTCRDSFANTVNFRGFPHIPGTDAVLAYPDAAG